MTKLQALQFKASEIRSQLAKEEDSDKRDELVTQYGELESEIRAQMVIDDEQAPDAPQLKGETVPTGEGEPEDREYRELVSNASVADVFNAVSMGSEPEGATRELQAELKLRPHVIPLDLLREERAVTPAPTTAGLNQQTIEPGVFDNTVAAALGIPMPRVAAGSPLYPDVGTNASVKGPFTDSTSAGETTGSFNTVSIVPARFQASFFYLRTEAARFAGMDAALRNNLQSALALALDKYVIAQLAGDSNISANTTPTKALTALETLLAFAWGRVDGKWARSLSDLRAVINPSTYQRLAQLTYLTDRNAMESLAAMIAVTVSDSLPAVASNIRKNIVRIGNRRDAVAPIWEGVQLINDEITKAATGEIVITAIMLANFKVLRTDGFYLVEDFFPS